MQPQPSGESLTEEQFTIRAIERLRKQGYAGIHSVYSGFNDAFRQYFGSATSPVVATTRLAEQGKIDMRYTKGGAMLYKPGEAPKKDVSGEALKKMGL